MSHKKNNVLFLLLFLVLCPNINSQSIETGFVMEYNGDKVKTPLGGVELRVIGAPSTVSDVQGKYELKFAVLKPGESVKYNEIYKPGYVIFNRNSLDCWRISNRRTPFIIVMCKESSFQELKKKFYGIIETSYRDEYLKQKAIAEQTATSNANLETRLRKLKDEYEEKISKINTYVELFARIDRSEMDSIVGRALSLIEAGKIDEGITVYEELKLIQQVEPQLDKWNAGEKMRKAADDMISKTQQDLVVLAEKMQQQIGLYQMGGSDYNDKRNVMLAKLVEIYKELNRVTDGNFNEEQGMWMCELTKSTKFWPDRFKGYQEAAALPSWHGMINLGDMYSILAYNNNHLVDSARHCYQNALKTSMPDSLKSKVKKALVYIADFYVTQENGDTLFYKIINDSEVYVSSKTNFCFNRVSSELVIPEQVIYNGQSYKVVGIATRSFFRNRHLKKVLLPSSIKKIGESAFDNCDSLEQIFVGDVEDVKSDAIPLSANILLPSKLQHTYWLYKFVANRLQTIVSSHNIRYYRARRNLLSTLSKHKSITSNPQPPS